MLAPWIWKTPQKKKKPRTGNIFGRESIKKGKRVSGSGKFCAGAGFRFCSFRLQGVLTVFDEGFALFGEDSVLVYTWDTEIESTVQVERERGRRLASLLSFPIFLVGYERC